MIRSWTASKNFPCNVWTKYIRCHHWGNIIKYTCKLQNFLDKRKKPRKRGIMTVHWGIPWSYKWRGANSTFNTFLRLRRLIVQQINLQIYLIFWDMICLAINNDLIKKKKTTNIFNFLNLVFLYFYIDLFY